MNLGKTMQSQGQNRVANITFLIYIVFWETFILGGTAYVVFGLGHSGWWFVLAVMLSMCAYRPQAWIHGIGDAR